MCFVGLVVVSGCRKPEEPPSAPAVVVDEAGEAHPISPVYGPGPTHPLAVRLCDALFGLEARRRTECCGTESYAFLAVLEKECVQAASASVRSGASRLDEARLRACETAVEAQHAGCDWVGPLPRPVPGPCRSLFEGLLPAGSPCRSSLECVGKLTCIDASPTQAGRCLPPLPKGAECRQAIDPLASAVRDDAVSREKPECAGHCTQKRCAELVAAGGSCHSDEQCGRDAACVDGRCGPSTRLANGESCATGAECGSGQCRDGRCDSTKGTGEACRIDAECVGGCVTQAGGQKVCAKQCRLGSFEPRQVKSPRPSAPLGR
ncbi:MAG: hypothetical protein HYV07_30015 [Deltaproteobacteria bacterium]|nr:hypothetical protein [Deltaproteobacteria bacterium]